jgi:hypothetical protein
MEQKLHKIMAGRRTNRMLRCQRTNQYYTGEGWSADARRARTFSNELGAVWAFVANGMRDVELVLRFPGSDRDLFATPIE